MTEINTPADVLDDAARILDEFGWCRGRFRDVRNGHYCVRGAIMQVSCFTQLQADAGDAMAKSLGLQFAGQLSNWNDYTARDRRQVTGTMRKVAKQLRSQQ